MAIPLTNPLAPLPPAIPVLSPVSVQPLSPTPTPGLIACTIGTFNFYDFEVPEEIDHFGGIQKIVTHDFPGGARSVQTFGPFPPETIRWSGHLFSAAPTGSLLTRIAGLQALRVSGGPLQLQVGSFIYWVIVKEVRFVPRIAFWVPYTIEMVPYIDPAAAQIANPQVAPLPSLSGPGSPIFGPPLTNGLNTAPELPPLAPNFSSTGAPIPSGILAPIQSAPTAQIQDLTNSNSNLYNLLPSNNPSVPANYFPNVPTQDIMDLTTFQQSLALGLQQAQTNSTALSNPALLAQLTTAQGDMNTLLDGTDPGNAAFAAPIAPALNLIQEQLNSPSQLNNLSGELS